jgi:hypothetical protein
MLVEEAVLRKCCGERFFKEIIESCLLTKTDEVERDLGHYL